MRYLALGSGVYNDDDVEVYFKPGASLGTSHVQCFVYRLKLSEKMCFFSVRVKHLAGWLIWANIRYFSNRKIWLNRNGEGGRGNAIGWDSGCPRLILYNTLITSATQPITRWWLYRTYVGGILGGHPERPRGIPIQLDKYLTQWFT